MKIQTASDLHNEFEESVFEDMGADIVVLAGDIHLGTQGIDWIKKQKIKVPVVYVIGNHEYYNHTYPDLIDDIKKEAEGTNIHVLQNDVFSYEGVNFLGATLWTDFDLFGDMLKAKGRAMMQMNDYKKIKELTPFHSCRDNIISTEWIDKQLDNLYNQKNVVITHHAPSLKSVPDRYKKDILSASFASNLDELIEDNDIDLWIHGHTHDSFDYKIGDTRVFCNPKGYPHEYNGFEWKVIEV